MSNTPTNSSQAFVEKFDNYPLAKKLTLGFGVVVILMVVMAAANYFFTERLASIEVTISQKLVPIEIAELELKGSINESLAALRGYMLLGDNKFKSQRSQSWDSINKQVDVVEANIEYLSGASKSALSDLKTILKEFSVAQNKVESIANTNAEQPATRVLLEEAAPRAKQILGAVTNIINEEKKLPANSERKALLGLLADSRGSFAVGLASIRAYLLSGDEKWRDDFVSRWKVNEDRFQSLKENAYLFNAKQRAEFSAYSRNRQEFSSLPEKMFSIRSSKKWNIANYLLATEAAPRASKALEKIDFIFHDVTEVVHHYEDQLHFEKLLAEIFSFCFAAIAVVVAITSAKFITARITSSINKIKQSLEDIEQGELGRKIEVTSTDEIGTALATLEKMRVQLQEIIEDDVKSMIDSARKGDLSNRIIVDDKTGSYRELCNGVNELVEINNQVITETVDVFSALAHGNLDVRINSDYEGDFARIKKDANFTIDKLHHIIEKDVQDVINHAVSGDFSKRIDTDDKQGFFLDLSEKINLFIDSNQRLVSDVVRVFGAMSKGDLNESIQSDYHGEFAKLKEDANSTVHKLKAIIEQEIQTVVNSALEGDLSKKITEDNKQGFFKDLSSSINQLTTVSSSIIEDASNVVGAIAKGDLTQTIDHEYKGSFGELKGNVNNTVHRLKDIIENIHSSAESVNSGSSELAIGVNDLSERTEQQAASLEETAASMEQMTSSVQQSSTNAKEATDMTVIAEQCAVSGGVAVDSAVDAMKGINEASTKIANIIGVIDEIAFQTNLLALNAAVEAARAGEQGRGFAVVAGEVRTLAQRSAGAAKEIKDLIGDSVNRVENGSKLVNDSGETLKEIIGSVKQVSNAIASLSTAGEQQYVGIQQVNSAVVNMDQMTQQNAALVEQSSAACQGMSDQAQKLMELVSFFNTDKASVTEASHQVKLEKGESVVGKAPKKALVEKYKKETEIKAKPAIDKVKAKAPLKAIDADKKLSTTSAKKSDAELLRPDIEAGSSDFDMDGEWEEF